VTRFDLHPEDLLERAARGVASSADLARLQQHFAECEVCRVERALSAQAALDAEPLRDEKLVVARLKREVNARLTSPTARRARGKGALVGVAIALGTLVSVAAAATLVVVRRAPAPQAITSSHVTTRPPVTHVLPRASPERASGANSGHPTDAELAEPSGRQAADSSPERAQPPSRAVVDSVSSSELFSRANQARRDGKVTEAARLYRALQERFSGTSEELVSRVTLGRLLLDRLGDSRGALVQFNSYLASPGGGALREEAMVGRALALGRMGRTAEERAAWRALLDAWPKSTHGKRAQARLAELSKAEAAGAIRAGASSSATGKGTGAGAGAQ
jgi:hypothetical protein